MQPSNLEAYRGLVDAYLAELPFADELGALTDAMRYSLDGGGKRIRPVLCLATSEAVGASPKALLPAAAAVELVHTFGMVHDDLPALDDDDVRRGRATSPSRSRPRRTSSMLASPRPRKAGRPTGSGRSSEMSCGSGSSSSTAARCPSKSRSTRPSRSPSATRPTRRAGS